MRYTIESPVLGGSYVVGDNTPLIDAFCPIDGTQLVDYNECDSKSYSCLACGADYEHGDRDRDSLRRQAVVWARIVKGRADEKNGSVAELEKIVKAAKQTGVLEI